MTTTMIEAPQASQPKAVMRQVSPVPGQRPKGAFDWEERAQPGDAFAFKLWVMGYLVIALLAVSDWLWAILGW